MQESEKQEFASILKASMEVYDKSLSADALRIWWATMAEIPMPDFRKAITAHVTTSQFAPKPADILNQFKKHDGRPGVEEAWAMLPKSESESVIWTQEMATAFGAACPLIDEGDMIGARMAFKEAYQRELEQAAGKPIKWLTSFGTDMAGREKAVADAIHKNRITADRAVNLLPESGVIAQVTGKPQLQISHEGQKTIKQLTSSIVPKEPEENQEYNEDELLKKVKPIQPPPDEAAA
jgi:hypothetical protein